MDNRPTRNQLFMMQDYGIPEQKEDATELLDAGIYREPTDEEARVDDHPCMLMCRRIEGMTSEEYEAHLQAEAAELGLDDNPPEFSAESVDEIYAGTPDEVLLVVPEDTLPAKPTEPEDDGVNPILKRLNLPTQRPPPEPGPEHKPRIGWVAGKPTPTERFENNDPIY